MQLKKNYPWNVLVWPAASEVGLEVCRALRGCKEVVLHGAKQPGTSVASLHFRHLHDIPRIEDTDCLKKIQEIIIHEKIDAVFPAHDDVLVWLTQHAIDVKASVIAPDPKTCSTCRSKGATYRALNGIVPTPCLIDPKARNTSFPVFVKPDCGQGSLRARRIDNRSDLDRVMELEPDLLVMEDLRGREYTVDCFSQRGRGLLFAASRERLQIKGGIATLTKPVDLPYVQEWAEKISDTLLMVGAWFFQIREDDRGQPRLLEVAPRIAGSMGLSRAMCLNFPLLALYEAAGHDLEIDAVKSDGLIMGRALDTRYLSDQPMDALYVDLDHTLILNNEVNPQLIALIFQCHNRKIPVNLITRHKEDVNATLTKYRLTDLFQRIIHMEDDEVPKFEFIKEKHAMLIDDSFRERKAAMRQLGIRCFDAPGALCLLDERA